MSQGRQKINRIRLVAPLILIAFAVLWYQFSVVYIQGADNQLVAKDNLSVYVTIQQVTAYLQALRLATYATGAVGALAFSYYLVKLLRFMGLRCPGERSDPTFKTRSIVATSPTISPREEKSSSPAPRSRLGDAQAKIERPDVGRIRHQDEGDDSYEGAAPRPP